MSGGQNKVQTLKIRIARAMRMVRESGTTFLYFYFHSFLIPGIEKGCPSSFVLFSFSFSPFSSFRLLILSSCSSTRAPQQTSPSTPLLTIRRPVKRVERMEREKERERQQQRREKRTEGEKKIVSRKVKSHPTLLVNPFRQLSIHPSIHPTIYPSSRKGIQTRDWPSL